MISLGLRPYFTVYPSYHPDMDTISNSIILGYFSSQSKSIHCHSRDATLSENYKTYSSDMKHCSTTQPEHLFISIQCKSSKLRIAIILKRTKGLGARHSKLLTFPRLLLKLSKYLAASIFSNIFSSCSSSLIQNLRPRYFLCVKLPFHGLFLISILLHGIFLPVPCLFHRSPSLPAVPQLHMPANQRHEQDAYYLTYPVFFGSKP